MRQIAQDEGYMMKSIRVVTYHNNFLPSIIECDGSVLFPGLRSFLGYARTMRSYAARLLSLKLGCVTANCSCVDLEELQLRISGCLD